VTSRAYPALSSTTTTEFDDEEEGGKLELEWKASTTYKRYREYKRLNERGILAITDPPGNPLGGEQGQIYYPVKTPFNYYLRNRTHQ